MNKMKPIIFTFLSIIIVLTSCKTNYNVVRVDLNKKPSSKAGFFYMLPKNYLKINITLEKQNDIKGPYSEFAMKYFGLNNVISQNHTQYSIKDVNIETIAEVDTANIYFVETNNSDLKISFGNMGMISDVNCKEISTNIILKENNWENVNTNDEHEYPLLFRKFADLNMYEKIDTIYKKVKLDTSFIIEKTFKTSMVEKPTELKVKEIVDYITKLKDARFSIISGDVDAADKKNLEFMYNELQNQEEQYMKLFTGISINNTLTYSYVYYPETDTNTTITNAFLCKFSDSKGITSDEEADAENIYVKIDNNRQKTHLDKFIKEKNKLQKAKHGFYYRLPAKVEVSILKEKSIIYNCIKDIAQMGIVISLPQKNISIKFDEVNGSIKLMKIN